MTQLILDSGESAVTLPESQKGGYRAWKDSLSQDVTMVSGRLVREVRGNIWRLAYQYGFFNDELKKKVIAACEKGRGRPIQCGFLAPDSSGELTHSMFFVTSFTYPKFMWSRNSEGGPVALWADFSVELREVTPHD